MCVCVCVKESARERESLCVECVSNSATLLLPACIREREEESVCVAARLLILLLQCANCVDYDLCENCEPQVRLSWARGDHSIVLVSRTLSYLSLSASHTFSLLSDMLSTSSLTHTLTHAGPPLPWPRVCAAAHSSSAIVQSSEMSSCSSLSRSIIHTHARTSTHKHIQSHMHTYLHPHFPTHAQTLSLTLTHSLTHMQAGLLLLSILRGKICNGLKLAHIVRFGEELEAGSGEREKKKTTSNLQSN